MDDRDAFRVGGWVRLTPQKWHEMTQPKPDDGAWHFRHRVASNLGRIVDHSAGHSYCSVAFVLAPGGVQDDEDPPGLDIWHLPTSVLVRTDPDIEELVPWLIHPLSQ